VHHRTIQINHQPDATIFQFNILTFIYSSTCFGRSPAHHQDLNDCSSSLWFYLRIVVTTLLCSSLGRLKPARPRTQQVCHHDTKVKPEAATAVHWAPDNGQPAWPRTQEGCHYDTKVNPEAATAVIELLMMGGRTPELCWAVNKCQDNKLENCCIWMLIYLNWFESLVVFILLFYLFIYIDIYIMIFQAVWYAALWVWYVRPSN
jgi:hypothetical protein